MGALISLQSLPRRFPGGLGTAILTSPPGYGNLFDDREQKEFSSLDLYHLVSLALDTVHQEAREHRRADVLDLFLRTVLGHVSRTAGPERAKQLGDLLRARSYSSSWCLGDRRKRAPFHKRRRKPALLPEYEAELSSLKRVIPRGDSGTRYGKRGPTVHRLRELYPDLPEDRVSQMAERTPGEAALVLLAHRHAIAELTLRDRLTVERRRRKVASTRGTTLLGALDYLKRGS